MACELSIEQGPFFHPNEDVDVACFIADKKDLSIVPLGSHLDDWIGDDMVLHSTLVLGYPPIPFSSGPGLFATKAEINAVIDKYTGEHPQFISSCMARGGFSGGLSINEYDFSMGVIVESLILDYISNLKQSSNFDPSLLIIAAYSKSQPRHYVKIGFYKYS